MHEPTTITDTKHGMSENISHPGGESRPNHNPANVQVLIKDPNSPTPDATRSVQESPTTNHVSSSTKVSRDPRRILLRHHIMGHRGSVHHACLVHTTCISPTLDAHQHMPSLPVEDQRPSQEAPSFWPIIRMPRHRTTKHHTGGTAREKKEKRDGPQEEPCATCTVQHPEQSSSVTVTTTVQTPPHHPR